MATATAAANDRSPPLRPDAIPIVDLRLLSQSELYSLSLCSDSSYDLKRSDDVVIPKIDRSVFNESDGSRKQTYSRLRLAPAGSSSTSAVHRRAPHHRSSHPPRSNNVNDPAHAENSQIIRMLKELFKSNPNFEDVAPIEVETNHDPVVPEVLNPVMKRKRGRPRKHENAVIDRPPTKRMRNNAVEKVVFDNDREMVNSMGVKIDLVNLAGLEDPYGPEIRRRTEGMSTENQLLGFLRGLNGQLGSIRRKRMIVDASDFGDALPKGWKLSLSIKKKEGRVWLFCSRYISPSGRQFESCKDASIYLLSVSGNENLDKPEGASNNKYDDFALKGAYGNDADHVLQEDMKGKNTVHDPSPLPTSLPTRSEMQITLDIGDPDAGELFKCLKCLMIFEGKDDLLNHQVSVHNTARSQVDATITDWDAVKGGIYVCQFCNQTFYERNRYNDHVVTHMKNEINTPEASQDQNIQKDVAPVLMTGVPDKELPASVLAEGNVTRETYDVDSGDKINSDSFCGNHEISRGTKSNTDKIVQDLNILADGNHVGQVNADGNIMVQESADKSEKCIVDEEEVPGRERAPDVSASNSDFCYRYQPSSCINKSDGTKTSGEPHVECGEKSECILEQGISSGGCMFSPIPNEQLECTSAIGKGVVGMSTSLEVLNGDAVSGAGVTVNHVGDKLGCNPEQGRSSGSGLLSPFPNEQIGSDSGAGKDVSGKSASVDVFDHDLSETGILSSSICEKRGLQVNMNDMQRCGTSYDLASEKEKIVNSGTEVRSNAFEGSGTEVKKFTNLESQSLFSPRSSAFGAANNASIRSKQEFPQKEGFASSTAVPYVDKVTHGIDNNVNRLSYGVATSKLDGRYEVRSNAFDSYDVSGKEDMTNFEEEDNLKSSSSVSSWREKECTNVNVRSKASIPTMEEPKMQLRSDNCPIENKVEKGSYQSEEANLDDFQFFRKNEPLNNEAVGSLGSCPNDVPSGVMAFNTGNNLEFCSLVPSGNDQAFGFQDDVTGLYDAAMEECKQDSSERGLLDRFCIAEANDDIFGNKIYSTPIDELKFDEDRDMGIHELSLAFGNPHDLYEETISLEQKRDLVNCSGAPSKIEETFDVQTNLSMVSNSMGADLKGGRNSMSGLFSLSCNSKTNAFRSNDNMAYCGRSWEGLKSNEFSSSEDKNFMTRFGSNHGHPNEVVPCGMWKTGEGNQLQSGSANPPHAPIQSQSCFHSFDIMSEKVEDGLFRLDGRYNDGSGVSGLRSGRSEPVEFSFLTGRSEHNSHPLQGDSRVFSYNEEMEQAFDSSFWLGRNAMMPNIAGGRNLVTSVCAWCRNEFYLQPVHSEAQAGIGSLCPTCSAGFSGQINML